MKLNLKAFTLSSVIVCTLPTTILFIWCSVNQFGYGIVSLFETLHPSGGFAITAITSGSFSAKIPGILIAMFYTAADAFIISFAFASLYNFFSGAFSRKQQK